jgi:hypothetical protein
MKRTSKSAKSTSAIGNSKKSKGFTVPALMHHDGRRARPRRQGATPGGAGGIARSTGSKGSTIFLFTWA